MIIILYILLSIFVCITMWIFVNEITNWEVFGPPFKKFQQYCDIIEAEIEHCSVYKENNMIGTSNGFISNIPGGSLFGDYYFHHDKHGIIRIPRSSYTHHTIHRLLKGE